VIESAHQFHPVLCHWDDALRLAVSTQQGAVKPSAMLRKLGGERGDVHFELASQMGKQSAGHHIEGVQCASAHLHESKVQGGAELIQGTPPGTNRLFIGVTE
jgi:hypothetical protein